MSDLVGNPEDWFSRVEAQIITDEIFNIYNKAEKILCISHGQVLVSREPANDIPFKNAP